MSSSAITNSSQKIPMSLNPCLLSTLSHDELIKIMIEMKVMYDEELREARDEIIMKQFRIADLETLKDDADKDIGLYLEIINQHEDTIEQWKQGRILTIKEHEETIEEHEHIIDVLETLVDTRNFQLLKLATALEKSNAEKNRQQRA